MICYGKLYLIFFFSERIYKGYNKIYLFVVFIVFFLDFYLVYNVIIIKEIKRKENYL